MKILKHKTRNFIEAHISDDISASKYDGEPYSDWFLTSHIESIISSFMPYREILDYARMYGKENKLSKLAVLCAHGVANESTWRYSDGGISVPVQNWIDKMDGKFSALLLGVCNTGNFDIESKKSLVFYYTKEFSIGDLYTADRYIFKIFDPKINNGKGEYIVKKIMAGEKNE